MDRVIEISYDEGLALIDELSKLPYRDVHQLLTIILERLAELDPNRPRIVTN